MTSNVRKLRIASLTPSVLVDRKDAEFQSLAAEMDIAFCPRSQAAVGEFIQEADFILGDWTGELRCGRSELQRAIYCRAVVQPNAGYDSIDTSSANQLGLPVINTPGKNSGAVAEWAVMAALVLLRRTIQNHERLASGSWSMVEGSLEGIHDLKGCSVGFLGFGSSAQATALLMDAFSPRAFWFLRESSTPAALPLKRPLYRADDVDDLCSRVDILCIHVPLTDATRGIVGERQLQALGERAVIVNVARGGVVDEVALIDALCRGDIRGAAIDVFEDEPLQRNHRWRRVPNVLLSPHLAGSTVDARSEMFRSAFRTLREAASGNLPSSVVNSISKLRCL